MGKLSRPGKHGGQAVTAWRTLWASRHGLENTVVKPSRPGEHGGLHRGHRAASLTQNQNIDSRKKITKKKKNDNGEEKEEEIGEEEEVPL